MDYLCPTCNQVAKVGVPCPVCAKKQSRKSKSASKKIERKPWETDESEDGLDLPDEDFDYDAYIAREFGKLPHKKIGLPWYWWLTALVLLIILIIGLACF